MTSPADFLHLPSTISPPRFSVIPTEPIKVLIPKNFNGPFYYPPCKCDFLNQIRYFNPKTKNFYYHGIESVSVPESDSKNNVLVGEPEHFLYPADNVDKEKNNEYIDAFLHHHHAINHPGQSQGPYFSHGAFLPPGQYPIPVGQVGSSGLLEAILVSLALVLWLYSFFRLYSAWQRVLNFSEASIQGPQGWDLLVNWILERIRFKKFRLMQAIGTKKKQNDIEDSASLHQDDNNSIKSNSKLRTPNQDEVVKLEEGSLSGFSLTGSKSLKNKRFFFGSSFLISEVSVERDPSSSVHLSQEVDQSHHGSQKFLANKFRVSLKGSQLFNEDQTATESKLTIMETEFR